MVEVKKWVSYTDILSYEEMMSDSFLFLTSQAVGVF